MELPGDDVPVFEPIVVEMTTGFFWITPHPEHEVRSFSFESEMASVVLAHAH